MERVLYNLHHKCCTFALHHTSRRSRSWAEHTILVLAVCGFGALLLAHLTFVHRDRVGMAHQRSRNIPLTCLHSIPGFDKETAVTHLVLLNNTKESRVVRRPGSSITCSSSSTTPNNEEETAVCDSSSDFDAFDWGDVRFSYSREKGFLLLSPELCERHGIEAQYVQVSKTDARCFGEPFVQSLVFYTMLSIDTVMTNWLLGVYKMQGFIYNPRTRVVTDLSQFQQSSSSAWWSSSSSSQNHSDESSSSNDTYWGLQSLLRQIRQLMVKGAIIIKTLFLFFITTTLVSFTLRETQGRMLDFTHYLAEHVRANRPVVNLVTTHVVENLVFVPIMVGMIFFLIEFYRGDKFMAFMVLSLVWVCESFSVVR